MPIYDYKCQQCGTEYSMILFISQLGTSTEESQKQCPNCKSVFATRIIKSNITVIYKCHGFYSTDNKQ